VTVELLVVRDCAHAEAAGVVLARALAAEGLDPRFEVVLVDTAEQAQARDFLGSPAFVVDGQDLFASSTAVPGVACRVYWTEQGVSGLPDEAQLRWALKAALSDHAARRAGPVVQGRPPHPPLSDRA